MRRAPERRLAYVPSPNDCVIEAPIWREKNRTESIQTNLPVYNETIVLGRLYLIMPSGMYAVSTRGVAAKTSPTRKVLPPKYLRRESNLSVLPMARLAPYPSA